MKPDYSEYLNKPNMLDYIESEWINKPQIHDFHAVAVNDFLEQINKEPIEKTGRFRYMNVLEVGCGTGNIAKRLSRNYIYHGVDLNRDCINIAREKNNKDKNFICADIRNTKFNFPVNLVFTFGFLKHFGLHEWSTIFKKVCSLGEYLVFDLPIAEGTKDDGIDYHHVWFSMDDIKRNIDDNGFEILEIKEFGVEPIFICKKKIA